MEAVGFLIYKSVSIRVAEKRLLVRIRGWTELLFVSPVSSDPERPDNKIP
jgi:hypothetical protein